jgi:magnesium-transporting ATPase (P-type)
MVILDDSLESIVQAVLWGRFVHDSSCRLLQFQATVSVSALVLCAAGAITGFGVPLSPIQLLWVKLVTGTLAAMALMTEAPTPDMLLRRPNSRQGSPINGHMWRNILVQACYQARPSLRPFAVHPPSPSSLPWPSRPACPSFDLHSKAGGFGATSR